MSAEDGTAGIQSGASKVVMKKVGPLPIIGWVAGGSVVVLIYRHFHPSAKPAKQTTATAVGNPNPIGAISSTDGTLLDVLSSLNNRFQAEQSGLAATPGAPSGGGSVNANPIVNTGDANTTAVSNIYQKWLKRAPDAAGLAFWTNEAYTKGLGAVENGIASSGEAQIQSAYQADLHRNADAAGLGFWQTEWAKDPAQARKSFDAAAMAEQAKSTPGQ